MILNYYFFDIQINTQSLDYISIKSKLKQLYSEIPDTKCLFCPGKCNVDADCCKVFSPPMLLIEFIGAMEIIENWNKEKKDALLNRCLNSIIKTEKDKPCVLLDNTLCSIYDARPLGCRLFGLYPDKEWETKLNKLAKQLNIKQEDMPFSKQCRNIEVNSLEKTIPTERTDRIFNKMYKLDYNLFKSSSNGRKFVFDESATYMPFETHYICYKYGPDAVQKLTDIKLSLRIMKENKEDEEKIINAEKNAKEFVNILTNEISKI